MKLKNTYHVRCRAPNGALHTIIRYAATPTAAKAAAKADGFDPVRATQARA